MVSQTVGEMLGILMVTILGVLTVGWAFGAFGAYSDGMNWWFNSQSQKLQEKMSVDLVTLTRSPSTVINVYLRDIGTVPVLVATVYVNGTQFPSSYPTINVGQTGMLAVPFGSVSQAYIPPGILLLITITTFRGNSLTYAWVTR